MDKEDFTILAIDTSCDDTAVAITQGRLVLTNCISSQIEMHKKTGGVVPIDAARAHAIKVEPLIKLALKRTKLELKDLNAIAVTYGPGLAPALQAGVDEAKKLSVELNIPLIPVNHMSGHTYANWAQNSAGVGKINKDVWPRIVLLVSGGHTELILMKNHYDFKIIGETLDDACGECFDKVGRMLGLGYPAGPVIEKFAEFGNDTRYSLPRPMQYTNDLNVSYSGLKTAAFRLIKTIADAKGVKAHRYTEDSIENKTIGDDINTDNSNKTKAPEGTQVFDLSKQEIYDICASFQKAAFDTIMIKLDKAVREYNPKQILLGGGVVRNKVIRKLAWEVAKQNKISFSYPTNNLIIDNAAMIGVSAYYKYMNKKGILRNLDEIRNLDRNPGLRLGEENER